jgi:hypothetical protein
LSLKYGCHVSVEDIDPFISILKLLDYSNQPGIANGLTHYY